MTTLITAEQAKDLIETKPETRILDATYGPRPFGDQFIPDTIIFDIDAIADAQAPYSHTAPKLEQVDALMGGLGITEKDTILIYDQHGIHMAASRAWWLLKLFGHQGDVHILNGGLPYWLWTGGSVIRETYKIQPATYCSSYQADLLVDYTTIQETGCPVLDARDSMRFSAAHIEGSTNLPFPDLLSDDGRSMRSLEECENLLSNWADTNPIYSCGSGVTACVVALALHEVYGKMPSIYDGSWTEWSDKFGF